MPSLSRDPTEDLLVGMDTEMFTYCSQGSSKNSLTFNVFLIVIRHRIRMELWRRIAPIRFIKHIRSTKMSAQILLSFVLLKPLEDAVNSSGK